MTYSVYFAQDISQVVDVPEAKTIEQALKLAEPTIGLCHQCIACNELAGDPQEVYVFQDGETVWENTDYTEALANARRVREALAVLRGMQDDDGAYQVIVNELIKILEK